MNIYLYNEGLFWRAYEYSAHAFVNNLTGSINIHLGERIVNETVEMIIGVFKANDAKQMMPAGPMTAKQMTT